MNTFFRIFSCLALLACWPVGAAESETDASQQLEALVDDIKTKLRQGMRTEAQLSDELNQFDKLLEQYQGVQTDEVAQILFMKATLYLEVLDEPAQGKELLSQLKKDFPETANGKRADAMIAAVDQQIEAKKVRDALVTGNAFPELTGDDLDGKPLRIADYKGKVVLIDFWATWCGPCVAELPNVLDTYQAYHDQGFEIIGISLDKDESKLKSFIKQHDMTWRQYFDGLGWQNKLAAKYGVNSIPATYLLDTEGKIAASGLRGSDLKQKVGSLLEIK